MAARTACRRFAAQLRTAATSSVRSMEGSCTQMRGMAATSERQCQKALRSSNRLRTLRRNGGCLPTMVGKSGGALLRAFLASHRCLGFLALDDDGL